jgi:hypothetical protein
MMPFVDPSGVARRLSAIPPCCDSAVLGGEGDAPLWQYLSRLRKFVETARRCWAPPSVSENALSARTVRPHSTATGRVSPVSSTGSSPYGSAQKMSMRLKRGPSSWNP